MVFLSAEWKNLIMANYAIDADILEKYVPAGTSVDSFEGICYVSLVAFMFRNTKVLGLSIPFHRHFEEINLRFYVKRLDENGSVKRGVVFIKEIVPKPAITFVANTLYKEKYQTLKTSHSWNFNERMQIEYAWRLNTQWHKLSAEANLASTALSDGSLEEYISEHYWGYSRINDKLSIEYEVQHPRWNLHEVKDYKVECNFKKLYGEDFEFLNHSQASSVFLADGSAIKVMNRKKLFC